MLRNGKQFLAGLRDGRTVYVGGHRVDDVVVHPAFRGAARTLARLFDYKADPTHMKQTGNEGFQPSSRARCPRSVVPCASAQRRPLGKLLREIYIETASHTLGNHQSFIVRNHSFREAPWKSFDGVVEGLLDSIPVPAQSTPIQPFKPMNTAGREAKSKGE